MNWRALFAVAAVASLLPNIAAAQQKSLKEQLVGTWKPVSIEASRPDGSVAYPYTQSPKGILVFSETGHFSLQVLRPGQPKYASDDRSKGTAEEFKTTVLGGIDLFGTYTLNEADRTLVLHIEGSSFPNYNGFNQKRTVAIEGDELKLGIAQISGGGGANQVWRRAR